MYAYLVQWLHLYSIHFGAWFSFALAATIYKDGLPAPKEILSKLESALIMSAILSLASSHSHSHYLSYFLK